ncbi:MAG: hypothetical protein V4616_13835 [Bacteroidota bacterium]
MNFNALIKQEWIKLNSRRSLIFLIVALLINTGLVLLGFGILSLPPEDPSLLTSELMERMNPFGFIMSNFSSLLALIASMFFIMQYGDEYKFGLVRKNIIDGMSRRDIFNGKMVFIFGSYLLWTILFIIIFLICGAVKFGDKFGMLVSSMQFEQILKYYFHIIFYGALSFFLVSLTRSSMVSMIIFLGLTMILDQLLVFGFAYMEWSDAAPYLPITLASTIRSSENISNGELIGYLVYLVGFIGIGQWAIYKRDL